MAQKNSNLHTAKAVKNDEFYTRLEDIENELRHYKEHFRGKTVYCNCDDPKVSNFFKYFSLNFEYLGLKKLITACYRNVDAGKQTDGLSDKAVWLEYTGENGKGTVPTDGNIVVHEFEGDGDFRSEESIELLKQADIVVTNPPFSLFREYVAQLMTYEKQFLVLGNINAVSYKEVFPHIQQNKLWLGTNTVRRFIRPDNSLFETARTFWYTNLDTPRRHEEFILYKSYQSDDYPTYDNYDAIEVPKAVDIPLDYAGVMGVPITFLAKYNPDQFEIVDINPHFFVSQAQGLPKPKQLSLKNVGRKDPYARILIKHKRQEDNPT